MRFPERHVGVGEDDGLKSKCGRVMIPTPFRPQTETPFASWPNEQMIRVPENDLRLELIQLARADRFHAPLRPHRHVGRCLDDAARGRQAAAPRLR